jgi:NAD(P) transhydrogenase subunit beta
MNANIANLLYLVAGVLFILALRGLSHPTTSQQGNRFGMIGMGIAVLTTLALSPPASFMNWSIWWLVASASAAASARWLARASP